MNIGRVIGFITTVTDSALSSAQQINNVTLQRKQTWIETERGMKVPTEYNVM